MSSVARVTLRIGARGSALSLAQATLVREALAGRSASAAKIVSVKTTGDRLSAAGSPIEWKGDFTKELDEALQSGRIDLAVHSLKDVPCEIPSDLVLAAIPPREDPSDVLVANPPGGFSALPKGARIGTSSPRRRAQLLAARPDLELLEARGNIDTRIRRLREGKWDAIVLARAGLARLGRLDEISEVLAETLLLPAVGQGALAIVARKSDVDVLELLGSLDDAESHRAVLAERSLLAALEVGCRAPVAGRARVEDGALQLAGGVFSGDGSRAVRDTLSGPAGEAESIGRRLGEMLLSRGAASLLAESER